MTFLQAGINLSDQLLAIYDSREAKTIADMVIEKITGLTKAERLISKGSGLSPTQQQQLQNFTAQLLQHKPIQYVLNETWFAGLKFYVDENVLIPRPETEELVSYILSNIKLTVHHQAFTILDIGTGSGCIAIAIKKKYPELKAYALDISKKSLEIAQRNADENKANIDFFQADILSSNLNKLLPRFDVIVSNPPYIKQSEAKEMAANVLLFEPGAALFVPDEDPLLFYKSITDFGLGNLNSNGKLYFEINEQYGNEIVSLLEAKGFSAIHIKKDMQDKYRIISAVLKE